MKLSIGGLGVVLVMGLSASSVFAASGCDRYRTPIIMDYYNGNVDIRDETNILTALLDTKRFDTVICETQGDAEMKGFFVASNALDAENGIMKDGQLFLKLTGGYLPQDGFDIYITFSFKSARQPNPNTIVMVGGGETQFFPSDATPPGYSEASWLEVTVVNTKLLIRRKPGSTNTDTRLYTPLGNGIILGTFKVFHGKNQYVGLSPLHLKFDVQFAAESCVFEGRDVLLPDIPASMFKRTSQQGRTPFTITVNCPNAMYDKNTYVVISDVNNLIENRSGMLTNRGTAKNIGLKLYSAQKKNDPKPIVLNGPPYVPVAIPPKVDPTTVVPNSIPFGRTSKGMTSHNFEVVYEKLAYNLPVEPGTVEAEARVDVFYP